MLTDKVTRLGRKKTLLLTALLLSLAFQPGTAEAQGKKLTLRINQVQDDVGQPIRAGKATVGREDGRGEKTTQEFTDGRLEHSRSFVGVNYVIELEAQTAEGRKLGAKVTVPAASIQNLPAGGTFEVNDVVRMLAVSTAGPSETTSPSATPLPDGTPQAGVTPVPTPTPTLEEDVRGLRAVVSEQGATLQAVNWWLKLVAGLLGLLALAELLRAARWYWRRTERPLHHVELELKTIRANVVSMRQSVDALRSGTASLRLGDDTSTSEAGETQESAAQSLGDQLAEFSTSPGGSGGMAPEDDTQENAAVASAGESSFHDVAVQSYRCLVQGSPTSLSPLYVDAVVTGRPDDALGGGGQVPMEVTHSGAAYVLFARGDEGFVFPNPGLPYSPALRPVFPRLTEPDFDSRKDAIPPAKATRSGDGWKAEVDV